MALYYLEYTNKKDRYISESESLTELIGIAERELNESAGISWRTNTDFGFELHAYSTVSGKYLNVMIRED